jgi:hypothetical protein
LQQEGACFKYSLYITRIVRVRFMSYCPKCGTKVEENMAFCPRCGAPLKMTAPTPAAPTPAPQRGEKSEKSEKQEKHEKQGSEKGEKHEKGEYGFIGWLVGGLILILIGFVAIINISTNWLRNGVASALVLLIIGVIIIIVAVYFATMARRRSPSPS